jgi:Holliday junction resolvase RusA-like endonuclease
MSDVVRLQALNADSGVRLFVPGRPRTKGSMKPVHIKMGPGRCRVSLTESGEHSIAWKTTMIKAIRSSCLCTAWPGAVVVDTFFRFDASAGQERKRTSLLTSAETLGAELSPGTSDLWPVESAGAYAHGDEDKLRRNVLDALTQSGLIADDCLVVGGSTLKRFTTSGEEQGVVIDVRPAGLSNRVLFGVLGGE